MVIDTASDKLGANPVEELTARSGIWSLRFLWISIAITPIRIVTGFGLVNKFRRMIGLFAFFYCSLHLVIYIVLEHNSNLDYIAEDIGLSQFVQIGLVAYAMLAPLALTSTQNMMRRLGKTWKKLHNNVHLIAWLVILHYVLLVKADFTQPILYGVILFVLQFIRGIYRHYRKVVSNPSLLSD